jgi:hypothetical protein
MAMQLTRFVILLSLANAASASASPGIDAAVGYRWGTALVDGVEVGHVDGLHLDAGVRLRSGLSLRGEYDLIGMTYPAAPAGAGDAAAARVGAAPLGSTGLEHRFGANARYAFQRMGKRDGGLAFWLEGGPGLEHYVWDPGGVWTRPDFALGLGTTLWIRSSSRRYNALDLAVHGTFAPRNNVGTEVACGGPCDTPTTAAGWDRSVTWDASLAFGR